MAEGKIIHSMFLCQARGGFCVWLRRQGHSQWCHTAVQSLLGKESSHWVDKSVTIRGWVQSSQHHKRYLFFHVNDGSSLSNLQVVVSLHEDPQPSWANEVTPGSSVLVQGTLLKSNHSGQHVELAADSVELLGPCNTGEHLFKARGKLDPSYTRQFPHLRPRTRAFSSLLRLRDSAAAAVHEYLRGKGLVQVHTPIITPSDCEGAGDLFTVKPIEPNEDSDEFFGCKAYLTVSGQLYAEAVACGMSNVYTFGPTFRAEHTHTRRHLSEFHMIEPEMVLSELGTLLEVMQELFRASVEGMLREREEDLRLYHQESPLTEEWVMKSLSSPFQRMTYAEAVDVLNKADTSFRFTPKWGKDLQTEHEQYLTSHVGNQPLFVTDYPIALRPFYARLNDDGRTVSAVDLLVPGVGELAGGSLREERLDILENTLTRKGMLDSYRWYLDLRRYGTMPHGGFGLGFERLLQAVLGVKQIRDVVPFPRLLGSCKP